MKIRITLAALAAVATLTLTACGSEITGTAAPAVGADQASSGPVDAGTTDAGTTTESPTPGGDSGAAGSAAGCQQLIALSQDFSTKILKQAVQGSVTQADVDEVFSKIDLSTLPAKLRTDVTTLKDLSQQMVGKKIQDLTEILPKVQTAFQSIAEQAPSLC